MAIENFSYVVAIGYAGGGIWEEVLAKIKSVCDHNYSHMMRTDWYGQYFMPAFVSYFVQTQN